MVEIHPKPHRVLHKKLISIKSVHSQPGGGMVRLPVIITSLPFLSSRPEQTRAGLSNKLTPSQLGGGRARGCRDIINVFHCVFSCYLKLTTVAG